MNLKIWILGYGLTFLVFLAIDMLWLGIVAKNVYQKYLGALLSENVNWTAAFVFYFLFIAGIFIFSIYPAYEKQSVMHAVLMGALFGFFTYATYDLTNLATLKGWPLTIVFIDIAWGTFLSAAVAFSGYNILKWLN